MMAVSAAERVIEGFDELFGLSFLFERTVEPVAEPRTEIFRVVVLDLVIPFLDLVCSVSATPPLGRRSGDPGEIGFVVVKNPNTLSATILILALALL